MRFHVFKHAGRLFSTALRKSVWPKNLRVLDKSITWELMVKYILVDADVSFPEKKLQI